MNAREQVRLKRAELLAAAARHGALNVRLFGSVARGQEVTSSDVDFLVALEPDRSLLDHVALQQEFTDILGCRVDVVVEGGVSPYLEQRIVSEAVPV